MSRQSPCLNIRGLLSLGVFLLLLLTSCSASHRTYTYANFIGPGPGPVHPGEQLTFTWAPSPGPDSNEATPTPITLEAVVFGPYSSPTAVLDAEERLPTCPGVLKNVVASITPVHTDDWTNALIGRALLLPPTLSAGYYAYLQEATLQGKSSCAWGANMLVVEAS